MAEENLTQQDFLKAVSDVCSTFGVQKLYPQQEKALSEFLSGSDVFVNLPTGYGKSIIYQMAPLVANELSKQHSRFPNESIVVIISPLVALMKDQVSFLKWLNICAEFVAADQVESVLKEVEAGKYRLVYTSPESMLSADRWRRMLTSKIYQKNLIGIAVDEAHCISHWGLSANKGRVAFRQWYSCLKELRSLVPSGLPFLALTATACKTTKKDIFEVLEFKSPCEVVESPDRRNIVYSTQLMEKGRDVTDYFWWLLSDIKDKGAKTDRVLIYCQSVKQCTQLYQVFSSELKSKIFADENPNPKERLVEMLHSKTPKPVKDIILDSFTKNDGHVRVLFATIAFGMGVNAKGVKTIIHVGPSKNLEAYVQESGRCGRSGEQSRAIVLFNNKMCVFCDKDIKDYVVSEQCRRNILRKPFDASTSSNNTSPPELLHNCCDNCAKKCDCNQAGCQSALFLPAGTASDELLLPRRRDVSALQKDNLQVKLKEMRKALVKKAMQGDQRGRKATVISCPSFFLEFSDVQIKQVLDNCEAISSISDVMKCVEVWQYKHAEAIYALFYEVFHDVPPPVLLSESSEDSEDDGNENLHEWPDLLEDDSFQQMLNSGLFGDSSEISGLFANSEDEVQQTSHMYPLELDSVLQNVDMQCE